VIPWVGVSTFGTRQSFLNKSASYRASLSFGARAETPLSRRAGILANVGISPLARQRVDQAGSVQLADRVALLSADLSLAWRFAARAPVFFYGGGGVLAASRPAYPDFKESALEPRAVFGIGYDTRSEGDWNVRIVASGMMTFPSTPSAENWQASTPVEDVQAKSSVMDWTLELGARYRFNRAR
jgi:hypothetical protein